MATTVSRCHGRTVLLALLAALSGCGLAPSDEASNLGATGEGCQSPFPALREVSVPLETGTVASKKDDSPPDSPHAEPVPLSVAARPAEKLVVPDWMAKDLASADIQVRLKAVDRWAQSAPTGSVDPLIQALEDQDERVPARALELIEQDWAREQRIENSE